MVALYKFITSLYFQTIRLISPFNKKASLWAEGRKNIFTTIKSKINSNASPIAWFHCASLGEFEQARPVIEKFKQNFPIHKICLTFFSPSGFEIRKNYTGADFIFYLPEDTKENAQQFIQLLNPAIVFFTKYEFWYFYLHELKTRQIPAISFSAKFRKNQLFFKSYGGFYKALLNCFTHIFVQDEESLNLLKNSGITHTSIAGDTRFDRVLEIFHNKKAIPIAEKFQNQKEVFVIGSSWPQDMQILIPFINNHPEIKFIIAPHEIYEEAILSLQKNLNRTSIRFSEANKGNIEDKEVLIIDNIGMLSSLYQYGSFAYIGGGFGKGIHNILEATTYGIPVFFGPNYKKFNEAVSLEKRKGAFSVETTQQLEEEFTRIYQDKNLYHKTCSDNKGFVLENTGATEKIIQYTKSIL